MFYQDHNPPHFHAVYQEYEAVIEIETLQIQEGHLPNKAYQLVYEWANLHKDELRNSWIKAQKPEPLTEIAPLE